MIIPIRKTGYCIFILGIFVLPAARPIETAMMGDLEKYLVFTRFLILFKELQSSDRDRLFNAFIYVSTLQKYNFDKVKAPYFFM